MDNNNNKDIGETNASTEKPIEGNTRASCERETLGKKNNNQKLQSTDVAEQGGGGAGILSGASGFATTKVAVNEGLHKMDRKAPPVPQSLRHLPVDHPDIVLRDPTRFGTVKILQDDGTIHIHLHKTPTSLTAVEKEYIYCCEKSGRTSRAKYQNCRQQEMYRCP